MRSTSVAVRDAREGLEPGMFCHTCGVRKAPEQMAESGLECESCHNGRLAAWRMDGNESPLPNPVKDSANSDPIPGYDGVLHRELVERGLRMRPHRSIPTF